MSVVAALVHGARVFMASDRQQTVHDGNVRWPSPPKVQRHEVPVPGRVRHEVLLAPVGSAAMAQLARYRLEWPTLPVRRGDAELDRWAFDVASALTDLSVKHKGDGADGDNDGGPIAPFDGGMLAYDGRLWGLGPWQALPMARRYEACGSGGQVATGALGAVLEYVGDGGDYDPAGLVALAVRVACEQDAGCGFGVDVHVLEPAPVNSGGSRPARR